MILTDALSAAQAKTLVTQMVTAFPDTKSFVEAQYPAAVRTEDTNGAKAKELLRRMVAMSALELEDRGIWRTAISGL